MSARLHGSTRSAQLALAPKGRRGIRFIRYGKSASRAPAGGGCASSPEEAMPVSDSLHTTLALDAVPRDLGATAAVGGWTLAGLVVARCQAGVLGVPLHVRSCIICNGFHNNPYIHIPLRSWPLGR